MGTSAGTILQIYYALRQQFGGSRPPAFFRKRTWEHAEAFLEWCAKAGIKEPEGFLEYRFKAAQHSGYVPNLTQLRSNKLAEIWHDFRRDELNAEHWSDDMHARAGTRQQQAVRALRLLTPGMEAAKHPYMTTGQPALCLHEIEITGGYHPESVFCPRCPKAVECAARLYQIHGFDVASLRAGRLNVLPPEVAKALVS